jgi:hypothetical protein
VHDIELTIMLVPICAFEQNIIPAYFDNPIVFASFLSKIHRWGFNRVSSRQTGHCEFRSPTFKRLSADSAPAAAADVADDSSNNAGGGASIQQQQQQQPNQATSSLLQQFFAQTNQLPPPDHPLSNQTGTIADLISHIQRQRSSQQPPSIPSQQSALNHLLNMDLNLHPFQQLQHQDPTLNLLKTALSILVGSETPSAQPYSPAPDQRNAIQALLSLYGMSSLAGTLSNSPPPPDISQHNNVAVQSLLMLIHRACEDERERRVQAVATQNAIIASIGQILGLAPGGTSSRMNVPLSNPTGMTVSVPNNITFQADHGSGFQANPIAAILQAARSMAGGQRGEVAHQTQIAADDNDDNINDDSNDDRGGRLSERKRDDDDNSPRKKKK